MSIDRLFSGPVPLKGPLKLGPTDAAVVLRNGRVHEVRRAGRYRRVFSMERLAKTGGLGVLLFHVGEVSATVSVRDVPVADDFSIDWSVDLGLRWVGGDDVLELIASRYSPAECLTALRSELRSEVGAIVREAAASLSHEDHRRSVGESGRLRPGRRLLAGALEIVGIRDVTQVLDPVALKEIQSRKLHVFELNQQARDHKKAKQEAVNRGVIRILDAGTDAKVLSIAEGGRATTAAAVGRALGVPPWWIYNPDAYTAELAANRAMLDSVLAHGLELGVLAEQTGLQLSDLRALFAGFQGSYLDATELVPAQLEANAVVDGAAGSTHAGTPRFRHVDSLSGVVESLGYGSDVAGSALSVADGVGRGLIVAKEIAGLRSQAHELQTMLVQSLPSIESAALVIAPYMVRTLEQVQTLATSIAAESGITAPIGARPQASTHYTLASTSVEVLALQPWCPVMEEIFEPTLTIDLDVDEE